MKIYPISIEDFNGLYKRSNEIATPKDFFSDCLNVSIGDREVKTREGSSKLLDTPAIVRYHEYNKVGETPRKLYLSSGGALYDSLYPGTPLITNAAFLDFSVAQQYNRAYVSFHNGLTGLSGVYLYVYDGTGPTGFRLAAGSPPSGFTLTAATSASSGNIAAGTHLFAVAFETASGFVTAFGPDNFTVYEAPGDFSADIGAIPIGPSGTTKRRLFASKAIADYNGNQYGYIIYAIPEEAGGVINDNTTTTATVNFFDAALIDDSDYLLENLSLIPSGVMINVYNDRLIIGGENANPHLVRVSEVGDPETINALDGYIATDPSDARTGVKNCIIYRNILYIAKGNKTIGFNDNGNPANTWVPAQVDGFIGSGPFGISNISSSTESTNDRFFQADTSGLFCFEGFFKRPEASWNIAGIWDRINKAYFHKVVVTHNPEAYEIFVGVPLDAATDISHVLMGNYQDAFNPLGFLIPQKIQWLIYEFPSTLSNISTSYDSSVGVMRFNFSYLTGDICKLDEDTTTDEYAGDEYLVDWLIEFGPFYKDPTYIYKLRYLGLQLKGTGTVDIIARGLNNVRTKTYPSIDLEANPSGQYKRLLAFLNEKPFIKLVGNNTGDVLTSLNSLSIDLVQMYKVFDGN